MAKKATNKETVSKASDEALDIKKSQEIIEDASDANLGDEGTKEIIEDTSDANLGDENTPENKEGTSDANLGDEESQEEVKTYFEDENGNQFGFTKRTPEKFRFNGVIKSQAQWLQDEDAMEMLIYGNSMYINKLN